MECPNENVILEFVAGALPEARAEGLHSHLDDCALCQRLVGELARAESLEMPPKQEGELPPLVPGARLDRYFILGELGAGGMGVVYAAFDPALDRKLALKLLKGPRQLEGSPEARRRWLLTEAQALARLSHPNVVTLYEARVIGEQLFLALEFADGGTLESWLRERPRPRREVLEVFLAAGEGLHAAHAAGIVHRDFKPSNVLIRRDGRVQVTDFGLARLMEGPDTLPEAAGAPGALPSSLSSRTTWRGSRAGTPAYMAPEQLEGGEVDARTDQYSFCVALHEALCGQRPATLPLPRHPRVPARIRRVLQRGLSPTPEERFASMRELLAALAREPLSTWRIPLAVAAAAGLLVVGGVVGGGWGEPQPCQDGQKRWERFWGPERRQAVRAELLSGGDALAETAWREVDRALDSYSAEWVAHYTEACQATRVHGQQSESLLDARMQCLEHRARDFQALTELLSRERPRSVHTAASAAWGLPELESCTAQHAQAAIKGLPAQGPARELVESIKRQLSEVRALRALGQHVRGLELMAAVRERLPELAHAPTRAEAFQELGRLYMSDRKAKQAEEALLEAVWAAEAGRYDRLVAEARIALVYVYGDMLLMPAVDADFVREAQAAVARVGDEQLEADLERMLGGVLMEQDRCAEAVPHIERAKAFEDRRAAANTPQSLGLLVALGRGLQCKGELPAARATFQQAVRLREQLSGPESPLVANLLVFEGRVALLQRDFAGALALFQRSLSLRQHVEGPRSEWAALHLDFISAALLGLERTEEARRHAREAVAILEELGTPSPSRKPGALWRLAQAEIELGNHRVAVSLLEQALRSIDGRHPSMTHAIGLTLAEALHGAGMDLPRARRLALEGYSFFAKDPSVTPQDRQEMEAILDKLQLPAASRR